MKKYIIAFLGGLSLLNSCNLTDLEPELIKAICLWSGSDYPKLLQAKQGMLPEGNHAELEEIKQLHLIRRKLITARAEVQFYYEPIPSFCASIPTDKGISLKWDTGNDEDNPRDLIIYEIKEKFGFTTEQVLQQASKQVYLTEIFKYLEGSEIEIHFDREKNGILGRNEYEQKNYEMELKNFSFKAKPYDPASFFLGMINFSRAAAEKLATNSAYPDPDFIDCEGSDDYVDYEDLQEELAELFDELVKVAKAEIFLNSF